MALMASKMERFLVCHENGTHIWVYFGGPWNGICLLSLQQHGRIFYSNMVYFRAKWYFIAILVYFIWICCVLLPLGIFYCHLVVSWYILWSFSITFSSFFIVPRKIWQFRSVFKRTLRMYICAGSKCLHTCVHACDMKNRLHRISEWRGCSARRFICECRGFWNVYLDHGMTRINLPKRSRRKSISRLPYQGCQIFRGRNIPKRGKMYQITTKYTKWP
jgi:hypothetical protein